MSVPNYESLVFSPDEVTEWDRKFQINRRIVEWRKPLVGHVDMTATARALGIGLRIEPHHCDASLYYFSSLQDYTSWQKMIDWRPRQIGPYNNYWAIRINEDFDESEREFLFGHELGHLGLALNGIRWPGSDREYEFQERVAEHFAREFILAGGIELPYDPLAYISEDQLVLFDEA